MKNKLDSITGQFKLLEARVKSAKETLASNAQKFSTMESKFSDETANVKTHVNVISSEIQILQKENADLKKWILCCEYKKTKQTISVWNLPCDN